MRRSPRWGLSALRCLLLLGLTSEASAQTTCTASDTAVTAVIPDATDTAGRAALAGDCTTLLGLMDTLRGTASLNWANTLRMDHWDGVIEFANGNRVARIALTFRGLDGSLPPDLSALTSLYWLEIRSNQLTGSIPDLSALTSLQQLYLHENQLTGSIDNSHFPTSLQRLWLTDNQLTGSIPDLSALTSLQQLYLHENQLTGSIDNLHFPTSLQQLYLYGNQLTGSIPDLSTFTSLQHLQLGDNQLTGSIDNSHFPTGLQWLTLDRNKLSGTIPDLSGLSSLSWLHLHQNELTGSINNSHFPTSLQQLYLYGNQLTGSIPNLSTFTSLQHLYLHRNQLAGSIPDLSALTSLVRIALSHNQLTGSIDNSHFPTGLQWLILNRNKLSGTIPDLSGLSSLSWLYLHQNELTGSIPTTLGSITTLQRLHLAANGFTGGIPSQLGGLTSLVHLSLCGTNLDAAATLPAALETRRTDGDLTVWSCLRIEDASATEGSALSFMVEHSTYPVRGVAGATGGLTLSYETEDGTASSADYTGTDSGSVTIPANTDSDDSTSSAAISVPTTDDTAADAGETLTVTLLPADPEAGWGAILPLRRTATGTILDNDTSVTVGDASATEGEALTFSVTLDQAVPGGLSVTPSFTDITARKDVDYTENTAALAFAGDAGETRTFTVATIEDALVEGNETFTVGLTVSGTTETVTATDTGIGSIRDDDGTADLSAIVNPGADADMGSQLLFLADTGINARAHTPSDKSTPTALMSVSELLGANEAAQRNFISAANTAPAKAVTVLVQYHNDEMEPVLWYLRVLRAGASVLVDPFNHEIPGTSKEDGSLGPHNVRDLLFDEIPAVSFKDEAGRRRAGFNSGRFVIAVTAVAARSAPEDRVAGDPTTTANILFPDVLAKDLHGIDNIDAIGDLGFQAAAWLATDRQPEEYEKESTSRNAGPLNVHNYEPIAFNALMGHHTTAEIPAGIAWGVSALVRAAVSDGDQRLEIPYTLLDGGNGARLSPKVHGGVEALNAATDDENRSDDSGGGSPVARDPTPTENNRVINDGALVWSSLYGNDHRDQRVQFLSVADDYGEPGEYRLIAAKTMYKARLFDQRGNELPDPIWVPPVYGPVVPPHLPGLYILVDGIGVMPDASPMSCSGNPRVEGWSLSDLTDLVPTAWKGDGDFQGLDAVVDPNLNASPGWMVFERTRMTCAEDFGDGDPSNSLAEVPDGVPTQDQRSFIGGTLVVEKGTANRTFVTAGQVILKFLTPNSAFGASWWLTRK